MATFNGRPVYRIRNTGTNRRPGTSAAITVPPEFARLVPEGTLFAFSTTETGFAYELVELDEPSGLPAWVQRLRGDGR